MVFASVHVQLQKTKNGSTAALMLILELLFVQMFHQVFREHSQGGSRLTGIPVFHWGLWSFLCTFPQCQVKQKLGWNCFWAFLNPLWAQANCCKCLEFCYNKYSIELELVAEYCNFFWSFPASFISKQASGKSASNCVQGWSSIGLQDTC